MCNSRKLYSHWTAQIDEGEVRDRASEEHNRKDEDHTGTPVRERERIILELTCTPVRERELVPGRYMVLLIHNVWNILLYLTVVYAPEA